MAIEFDVELTAKAREDLGKLGALTRNLLGQALRDELRTAKPSLLDSSARPVAEAGWHVLPIGSYRVLFRSLEEPGEPTRVVARILDRDELARLGGTDDDKSALERIAATGEDPA